MLSLLLPALALRGVHADLATGFPAYPGRGGNNPGFNITWPASADNYWPVVNMTFEWSNDTRWDPYGRRQWDQPDDITFFNLTTWLVNWYPTSFANRTERAKVAPVVWTWSDEFVNSSLHDNPNDTDWKLWMYLMRSSADVDGGLSRVVGSGLGPLAKDHVNCTWHRNYTADAEDTSKNTSSFSAVDRSVFPDHTCSTDMTGSSLHGKVNDTWVIMLADFQPASDYFIALVNTTKGDYNPDGATYLSVSSLFSMKETPRTPDGDVSNIPLAYTSINDPNRPKWLIDAPIIFTSANGTFQIKLSPPWANESSTSAAPSASATPSGKNGAAALSAWAAGMMGGALGLSALLLL